jgi:hypothetical protein
LAATGTSTRQRHSNTTRRLFLLVTLISVFLLALIDHQQGLNVSAAKPPMQKGISYATWWSGGYVKPGTDYSLELLSSTGANWISLIVTGYQANYLSTTIDRTSAHTPTDAELIHVIQQAHNLGLKVMLKPHVDLLDESNGFWRGDIGDGFTTEAQWSAWFASYRSFIEHYAQLAQDNGADQFCVGTELLGTTRRRPADWRTIVAGVRAIFTGPITYAALKEGEEVSITWWDAVDYIGVDSYYQLTSDIDHDPTEPELEQLWTEHVATMANLSASNGNKPILLTEVGFRSQHGCSNHPWDSEIVSPVDLEEQGYAYQATFQKLYNQPWLAGMFWWFWPPDRFESGPCNGDFPMHLKPAENVLRAWYGAPPLPSQPLLLADATRASDIYSDGLASGWQNYSWGTTRFDPAATDQKFSGTHSLAATLSSWGAISLQHSALDSGEYHWLEFYIRGAPGAEPRLAVFIDAADGTLMDHVPVNDCRFVAGGTIDAGTWKRVQIPLSELNRQGKSLTRLTIQDQSGQGASFWIDGLRFIGATTPLNWTYLPLLTAGSKGY